MKRKLQVPQASCTQSTGPGLHPRALLDKREEEEHEGAPMEGRARKEKGEGREEAPCRQQQGPQCITADIPGVPSCPATEHKRG